MEFCTTPTSLSLQDLITAPARAESLLELLTPDQIFAIEQTLGKVKKRRLDKEDTIMTETAAATTAAADATAAASLSTSATMTTTNTTNTTTPTTTTTTDASPKSTATKPPTTPNEPVTEMRDGIEWVSFVYSHNRTLKRYSIRTDLLQVDTLSIDDKFKSENCVSISPLKSTFIRS